MESGNQTGRKEKKQTKIFFFFETIFSLIFLEMSLEIFVPDELLSSDAEWNQLHEKGVKILDKYESDFFLFIFIFFSFLLDSLF